MSSIDDVVSVMKGGVQNIGLLTLAIQSALPRVTGTFTLSNATTTVVSQPSVSSNAVILLSPINASAALTQRTSGLYVSAVTAGVSFSISTQSGSAAGGEVLSYVAINLV